MRRERIIFCLSYLNLPKTLGLVKKYPGCLIITHNEKIVELFERVEFSGKVKLIQSPLPFLSKSLFSEVLKIILLKEAYWKELKSYSNADIYFGFISYCFMEAWLVKKLRKQNQIIWLGDVHLPSVVSRVNFRARLDIMMAKLLYGIQIVPVKVTNKRQFALSANYFKSVGPYKTYVEDTSNIIGLNDFFKDIFFIPENTIMILTGGEVEAGLISESAYVELLFSISQFSIDQPIYAKPHPRFGETDQAKNIFKLIPAFLPANLLVDRVAVVVGFSSATLFEAANQGYLAISLLKLINEQSEEVRFHKKYLDSNCSNGKSIIYPETLEELEKVLGKSVRVK